MLVLRKPVFCICENKDADQLRGNREADQRLCFRYTDSTIPLLSKSEISSLWPSTVAVQPGLCQTWSETPKTGFLTTRLTISHACSSYLFPHMSGQMSAISSSLKNLFFTEHTVIVAKLLLPAVLETLHYHIL